MDFCLFKCRDFTEDKMKIKTTIIELWSYNLWSYNQLNVNQIHPVHQKNSVWINTCKWSSTENTNASYSLRLLVAEAGSHLLGCQWYSSSEPGEPRSLHSSLSLEAERFLLLAHSLFPWPLWSLSSVPKKTRHRHCVFTHSLVSLSLNFHSTFKMSNKFVVYILNSTSDIQMHWVLRLLMFLIESL